jgi:alpha-amylase
MVRRSVPLAIAALALQSTAQAGVMMQGFYWDVPSPAAGNASAPWWWDKLAGQANEMRLSGFTSVWLPPVLKGASGGYSAGYDPFDDYDLGSKNQKGTLPTRYGNREQLTRAVAMMRANGLDVYLDTVLNHRNGDNGSYSFLYANAYGAASGGRYQKGQYDFIPNVAQDPGVFDDSSSFGRNVALYNGGGAGNTGAYNYTEMRKANDWLVKALDVQGFRFDYAKGVSTNFVVAFLNYGAMANKFAVGEFWDSDRNYVQSWITACQNKSTAFDFPLREELKSMCNGGGYYDMRRLDGAGLIGINPAGAVTFVENHDTDHGTGPITQNKMLAYAVILTAEGYPCVFYRDWSTDPGCYGLKNRINNLVWIHENLANGGTQQRWKDDDVYCFERLGYPNLLVGLNDNGTASRTVNVQTNFGANVQLHDYTGNRPDVWTDGSGRVTITIPANVNGTGYVAYSRNGYGGSFAATQKAVTQEFAGADDLDIKPADNTQLVTVSRVYVQAGKPITGQLYWTATGWTGSTSIYLSLLNPSNGVMTSRTYTNATAQGTSISATAGTTGWYTFRIRSYNTPAANPRPPYWLKATYTAPQL